MDITMCVHRECNIRDRCYRAIGIASTIQSYADFKDECYQENGYAMCIPADDIDDEEDLRRSYIASKL